MPHLYSLKSKAISLVELMVTIAVMGVLAGGTVYIVKNQTTNAYIADGLTQMDALESATRTFYATYNCLPGDCIISSITNLPSGVTVNSGNGDSVINNWYFGTSVPSAGQATIEDVNATQQLVAVGMLTAPIVSPTEYIWTDTMGGGSTPYGLPSYGYAILDNTLNNGTAQIPATRFYYLHGKAPDIVYAIRSVHNNILSGFNGVSGVVKPITGAAVNVSFVPSVVATFFNTSYALNMNSLSYNVIAGMDKKADGDTPLSGTHQAVLVGMVFSSTNSISNYFVFMPVKVGATVGAVSIPAATNSTSNFLGMTYISATGTAGTTYSTFGATPSWSNLSPQSAFNKDAVSANAAQSTTNVVTSVDLVRPIWGLN